ncbi:MAG: hypothetical protein ACK511_08000 [Burkholderiales bacterium]|jgi:hypothetical protein
MGALFFSAPSKSTSCSLETSPIMKLKNPGQWLLALCSSLMALNTTVAVASPVTDAAKAAVKISVTQNTAYEFIVNVDREKQRYRFVTFIHNFESPSEGLAYQRSMMGWKGDYLFVRHQCGQVAEWRCIVDQVFTVANNQLIHLGAVESAACKELGCKYQTATGIFTDLYDVYQVNPVTGATDAPPLSIARRAKDGALVTDLDETWKMNSSLYQASLACLNQVAISGFETPCASKQSAWSALVTAAKLAHYTNRTSERESLFTVQAVGYCAKSADTRCQWRVAGVQDYFQRFQPGAAPSYMPSPVTIVSTTMAEPKTTQVEKLETGKAIKLKL